MTKSEQIFHGINVAGYLIFNLAFYVEIIIGWARVKAWIYEHETLSTGILALTSAGVGAYFLSRQTTQFDRAEMEKLRRRREAVRTVLPLALSSISSYAVASATVTKLLLDQCVDESLPERSELQIPDMPSIPEDAISILKELVEAVAPFEVHSLAVLIADIQVQASRLAHTIAVAGRHEKHLAKRNLEEYVFSCAMIYARVASFYDFGRRKVDVIPSSLAWREVHAALFSFDMLGGNYDGIREIMSRREKQDGAGIVSDRWTAIR